jgi:hypothetical protein
MFVSCTFLMRDSPFASPTKRTSGASRRRDSIPLATEYKSQQPVSSTVLFVEKLSLPSGRRYLQHKTYPIFHPSLLD